MLFCASFSLKAQDDIYYNSLNTGSSGFVTDLQTRIRSPYLRVSYNSFDETNIANFASYLISGTTRGVICIYSGYEYTYTPPFSWVIFSREHTWCQSWMPLSGSGTDQYQDQHHLFPTHQNSANNVRSNHPLGNVTTISSSFYDAKYGTNSSGETVYEPRSSQKGDAARAMLYMSIRYDGIGGYSWDFNWLNSFLPTMSEAPQDLNLLLEWHKEDPPEKWEVDRNNYIQSIQQNRNPFTDHPEYINFIDFNSLTKLNPSYSTEPDNYLSNLTTTVTGNSITLNWTDAVAGNQAPSGYIIEAYNRNNYFIPIDGSVYTDDTNLDSVARVNVSFSGIDSYTFSGLNNNTTYYFRVYSYNGIGALRNYKITGTVPGISVTTSNVVLAAEPANHVTNLSAGNITTSNITLNWTDALPGTQQPTGYLLLANNTNSFTSPSDGTVYTDDLILSDGSAVLNIDYIAADNYSFTSLTQNTTYYFRIYSYNGSGNTRNYKTDGVVPSINATTLQQVVIQNNLILLDNFNRADNNTLGNTPTGTNTFTWTETETVSGTGLRISSGQLASGSTTAGKDVALVNLSGMMNYPTILSNSLVTVQWAFNFRQSRNDPSGFDNFNYGNAFVLGMSAAEYATGNGYAVVIGQSGATDPIRLTSFTGGLNSNTKFTNLISYGDYGSEYLSVRVSYVPSTNTWSLFAESSATGFPQSDPRLTNTQVGSSTVNSVYTGTALNYLGTFWNHNTGASDNAIFDDIYITDPGGALNVRLSAFSSSVRLRNIILNWITDSENDNAGFDIERLKSSEAGVQSWEKIGYVNGKGTVNTTTNYSFEDRNLQTGKYKYRLKQIDVNGNFEYFALNDDVEIGVPKKFNLSQNYPNPFNPVTNINFDLPTDSKVTMLVYEITGREVAKLVNNEFKKAGYYTTDFNAGMLSSGVYFYSLSSDYFRMTKKMVILK